MSKKQSEEKWLEGRDRAVRVYLTVDEHALVRQAAAKVDRSISRFAVEAIVDAAAQVMVASGDTVSPEATEPPGKAAGRPAKGRSGGKAAGETAGKKPKARKRKET